MENIVIALLISQISLFHKITNLINQFFISDGYNESYRMVNSFGFVICLTVIVAIATISIVFIIHRTQRKLDRIQLENNEVDLEAKILVNLRELVKTDENRTKDKDVKHRKFVYKSGKIMYEMYSEDVPNPKPDESSNQNEKKPE